MTKFSLVKIDRRTPYLGLNDTIALYGKESEDYPMHLNAATAYNVSNSLQKIFIVLDTCTKHVHKFHKVKLVSPCGAIGWTWLNEVELL